MHACVIIKTMLCKHTHQFHHKTPLPLGQVFVWEVFMCVCVCMCTRTRTHTHTFARMHARTHVCAVKARMHARTHTHTL